jgi:LemA protein
MIFLIIALVVLGYFIVTYNKFQTLKTRIMASVQEIGNQLKRQTELIPNLVESTKGYLKHEKSIFDELTKARQTVAKAVSSGSVEKMAAAQDVLQNALGSLRVVVESNPEIKGSEVATKLMDELRDTSDKVMYSRRTMIDLVADFNRMIVTIPTNLVAKIAGFKKEKGLSVAKEGKHLEVGENETKTPKVNLE